MGSIRAAEIVMDRIAAAVRADAVECPFVVGAAGVGRPVKRAIACLDQAPGRVPPVGAARKLVEDGKDAARRDAENDPVACPPARETDATVFGGAVQGSVTALDKMGERP